MSRIAYVCRGCKGPPLPQPWEGVCPACGRPYRALEVRVKDGEVDGAELEPLSEEKPVAASTLMAYREDDESMERRPTGSPGIDWVFEGGLPKFGSILLGAKGGSGKSTWLWELFCKLAKKKVDVLYNSAEQSKKGLIRQFARCGPPPAKHFLVHNEHDLSAFMRTLEKERPQVAAIDSLQRLTGIMDESGYDMKRGAPAAVEHAASELYDLAEDLEMLLFMVCHVTNEGEFAGGSHLRHALDANLVITWSGDKKDKRRILEFKEKNRFGDIGRQALFLMTDTGLKDCGPIRDEEEHQEPEAAPPTPRTKPNLRLVPRPEKRTDK